MNPTREHELTPLGTIRGLYTLKGIASVQRALNSNQKQKTYLLRLIERKKLHYLQGITSKNITLH